jgi:hypothetical protein
MRGLGTEKAKSHGQRESRGKLAPKWDGSFRVTRVIRANTYHLQDLQM